MNKYKFWIEEYGQTEEDAKAEYFTPALLPYYLDLQHIYAAEKHVREIEQAQSKYPVGSGNETVIVSVKLEGSKDIKKVEVTGFYEPKYRGKIVN